MVLLCPSSDPQRTFVILWRSHSVGESRRIWQIQLPLAYMYVEGFGELEGENLYGTLRVLLQSGALCKI